MGQRISAGRIAIQNEMVPLILGQILKYLKNGSKESVLSLLNYLYDLNITNEMFKEHLLGLNLDPKLKEQFDKIEPGVKANFTRQYNKIHQAITKKAGGKAKKKDDNNSSDDDQSDEELVMLDEEEMMEIKKAKAAEKAQKKALNAQKRLDKFTKIRIQEQE